MHEQQKLHWNKLRSLLWIITLFVPALLSIAIPVQAQEGGLVQELTGYLDLGGEAVYRLPNLQAGDMLYIHMSRTSGNLDPWVALADTRIEAQTLQDTLFDRVEQIVASGQDPFQALSQIYDEFFLAWNDDFEGGYTAVLQYQIPADGTYYLLLSNSPAAFTFGEFRLLLGRNAPQVLSGDADSSNGVIAILDSEASRPRVAVQEITGTLTPENPIEVLTLARFRSSDILYAFAESTSGDTPPTLILRDFGNKVLGSGNLSSQESAAELSYQFLRDAKNYKLQIIASADGESIPTVEYRLLLGVNEPSVATGKAEPAGLPVVKEPTGVGIGVQIHQITEIDQVSERFGVVATLKMVWRDSALAFSPESCQCDFKTFNGAAFDSFVAENGIWWPEFTLTNQQGNRWTQNRDILVWPDGSAQYTERFTTDFQAPLFDFTRFPFDRQDLYIEVSSVYPEELVEYLNPETLSGIGNQLGEEEWYIVDSNTEIGNQDAKANFSLRFQMERYLNFYVFRIFLPILLIIVVSWITFFLQDYGKRIDVASANLLVFVAFNFTVSGDLPRLGYLTLMDSVLIGVFVISALVVVLNVFLKRLEVRGKSDLAMRIDRPLIWIYPLLYAVSGAIAVRLFLL